MLERFEPAYAYAYLATDGLILTEENQQLVDPADAKRWGHAAGAFTTVFGYAPALVGADGSEEHQLEAQAEAGGYAIDELVRCVEDGAMAAWAYLLDQVSAHPACTELVEAMDFAAHIELETAREDLDDPAPALTSARRLAQARFDHEVGVALQRMLEAAGGIPVGDAVVHEQVPDPRQRMAVWSLLLVGINSTRS
jgi:hypothetical protein